MIEVKNLVKYYGNFKALSDVSFSVKRGEIVGFLGPNGAGKTTTMKILTCYMYPTEGDVLINNRSVWEYADEIKKIIGYLPENNPLYPEMLVYSYLSFVADIRGISDKKTAIREAVEKAGLEKVIAKKIGELSKGYRQRVGLAQALLHNPEILILDEPTSGLDPNQIVEVRNVIKEIGKDKTIIISTHILSEVEQTCERAIIINNGKIVADGNISELKNQARGTDLVEVQLKGEFKEEEVTPYFSEFAQIESFKVDEGITSFGLIGKNEGDFREKIYQTCVQKELVLLEMHRKTRSLEYLFRKLTVQEKGGSEEK